MLCSNCCSKALCFQSLTVCGCFEPKFCWSKLLILIQMSELRAHQFRSCAGFDYQTMVTRAVSIARAVCNHCVFTTVSMAMLQFAFCDKFQFASKKILQEGVAMEKECRQTVIALVISIAITVDAFYVWGTFMFAHVWSWSLSLWLSEKNVARMSAL